MEAEIFQKMIRDNIVLLEKPADIQLIDRRYIYNLITLVFKFSVFASSIDLGAIFQLIWKYYEQLNFPTRHMQEE